MNFLDVRTDYAFKKIFGSDTSKTILISFLNAIIYENSHHKIKEQWIYFLQNAGSLAYNPFPFR